MVQIIQIEIHQVPLAKYMKSLRLSHEDGQCNNNNTVVNQNITLSLLLIIQYLLENNQIQLMPYTCSLT